MRVLLDTNVLIDYISAREPYTDNAETLLNLCVEKKLEGGIAVHSVTNAFYILRKEMTVTERKRFLLNICELLTVVGIDRNTIVSSLENEDFSDVEDCLQAECAEAFEAEYIVTRNVQDFAYSRIPAIQPQEFLTMIRG